MRTCSRSSGPRLGLWARSLTVVAVVGALGALFGCSLFTTPGTGPGPGSDPGPTPVGGLVSADIVIVDHPVGGSGVTDLACTFEATQLGTDGSDPIEIQVDWSASCGTHKSEVFTFHGGDEVFTSTYGDPAGAPLGMTFWATVRWTDARGSHTVRSASAACTY